MLLQAASADAGRRKAIRMRDWTYHTRHIANRFGANACF
jgi:hypothetical protein